MAAAALDVDGLTAGYGPTQILENISFSVPAGQRVAVLGRNGMGKTTLFATLMGQTRRIAGKISIGGTDVSAIGSSARALAGFGYVPQSRDVFKSLTVEENLAVGQRPGKWTLPRVYDFFPSIAKRRRSRGDQLSGGEQQMLSVGRALMGNPSYLLMDEPLEGLAPVIVDQLLAGLQRLKKEEDMTMLLVEQHAHLAMEFADTTIVLDRGAVVYQGRSQDLAASPEKMSALLGIGRELAH